MRKYLGWLNVGTIIAFVTTFLAISLIDPYANSLVDYGATPLVAVSLAVLIRKERVSPSAWIGMAISIAGIAILVRALQPPSSTEGYPHWMKGLFYAAISCVTGALNVVFSKLIVSGGIRRDRLMVLRMPGILVRLGLWIVFRHNNSPDTMSLFLMSILAVAGFAVPLFLMIFVFEHLEVKHVSFAVFLIPVFTFIASYSARKILGWQELLSYGDLSLSIVAGIMALVGVAWSERASRVVGEGDNGTDKS